MFRFVRFSPLVLCLWLAGCGLWPGGAVMSGSVLVKDAFLPGQTGQWLTERDGRGQSYVADEALYIALAEPSMAQYAALQEPLLEDFVLEVDVTQTEGSPNSSYGVLFRLQTNEEFYRFDITGTGLFVVEKQYAGGQWQRFTNGWQESAAIVQGLGRTNRLKVAAVGTQMTFYVNDQLVATAIDGAFQGGKIAVDASTFGQGGLVVVFDNLIARQP